MRKRWWLLILLIAMVGLLAFKIMGQGKEDEPRSGDRRKSSSGTETASRPATTSGHDEVAELEKERKKPAPRPEIKKRPKEEPAPVAVAVKGMQGFVTSPFNGKMVDVRDIPPGTLVSDPTFPVSEKKLFRVPPDGNSADGAEGK